MAQRFSTTQSVVDDTPVYYPAWVEDDVDGREDMGLEPEGERRAAEKGEDIRSIPRQGETDGHVSD